MPHLISRLSEEEAHLLKGYCNVSLDFRIRCIIAQAKLRILIHIKVRSRRNPPAFYPFSPLFVSDG